MAIHTICMEYPKREEQATRSECFFLLCRNTLNNPKLIKPGDDKSPKCPSIALMTTFRVNVEIIDAKNYRENIHFLSQTNLSEELTINHVNC